eukprot:5592321-Alexandrium_andersonii.AAC.1
MNKEKPFIPLFKEGPEQEGQQDTFMGPEVEVDGDFEDFSAHGDKDDWSDDASMGESTSPETNFTFVIPGKTDVFSKTFKKPKQ